MMKNSIISILSLLGIVATAESAMILRVNNANSFTLQIAGGATFEGERRNGLSWGTVSETTSGTGLLTDNLTPNSRIHEYTRFEIAWSGSTINAVSISPSFFNTPDVVSGGSVTITRVSAVDLTMMDFSGLDGEGLSTGSGTGDTSFSVVSIPEASTALMLMLGGTFFVNKRRRQV